MRPLSHRKLFLLSVCLGLAQAPMSRAADLSFAIDFDGLGSLRDRQDAPAVPPWHGPVTKTGAEVRDPTVSDADRRYLRQRYEGQLTEARLRWERETLRRQLEKAARAGNFHERERLEKLLAKTELGNSRRAAYDRQLVELRKQFVEARRNYRALVPAFQAKVGRMLELLPRLSMRSRHYRSVLLWGLWSTPEEAQDAIRAGLRNPFTEEIFDEVLAFGAPGSLDLLRVSLDHLLGQFDILSPATALQLGKLLGATVDELVCHSNGCRIAGVLISRGQLQVRKLRILGGDNVLFDLDYLQALQSKRHLEEITVVVTRGDVVPMLNVGWQLLDMSARLEERFPSFDRMERDPTYRILGLAERPRFDPQARFQVLLLSLPDDWRLDFVKRHRYASYSRVIRAWRDAECVNGDGTMNGRCIIR